MRRRLLDFTLLIALMLVVPSAWADTPPPADDEPSDVAVVWFDTLYDVVMSEATAFPAVHAVSPPAEVPTSRFPGPEDGQ